MRNPRALFARTFGRSHNGVVFIHQAIELAPAEHLGQPVNIATITAIHPAAIAVKALYHSHFLYLSCQVAQAGASNG